MRQLNLGKCPLPRETLWENLERLGARDQEIWQKFYRKQ